MPKIAYNRCFGGFSLSRDAVIRAREISGDPKWGGCALKGEKYDDGSIADMDSGHLDYEFPRHDPVLVKVIEELGDKANGMCAELAIADVPNGARYRIDEYDGRERVMAPDDYDWKTA